MTTRRALVLLGSPKGSKGSSANIGNYLAERLKEKGMDVDVLEAYRSSRDEEGQKKLLASFDRADLTLICFPLYVDTLPAGLLETLEMLYERRGELTPKRRMLAAECQSGFPEATQIDIALQNCRHFAERMGMEFAGGMAIGEGGMLGQFELKEFKYAKNHLALFDRAAECLANEETIPDEVIAGLQRPFVPKWMYVYFTNRNWNEMAKGNGVRGRIKEKPHLGR